jgi:hypothetical protein
MIRLIVYGAGDEEAAEYAKKYLVAQMDNASRLGLLGDYIIMTNFPFEYAGVRVFELPGLKGSLKFANKWLGAIEGIKSGILDREIWMHDIDAWQDVSFGIPEGMRDISGVMQKAQVNTGSMFLRPESIDMIESAYSSMKQRVDSGKFFNDEVYLQKIMEKNPERSSFLNSTYNVGKSYFHSRLEGATKPVRVFHLHPDRKKTAKLLRQFASNELLGVLGKHWEGFESDR